jgi:hypothetical protein
MNFITDIDIEEDGISFLGELNLYHHDLVEVFGLPDYMDECGCNSTCYWSIKFEDDTIATIYDWRTHVTPLQRYKWHIGGFNGRAFDHIKKLMSEYL